MTPEQIFAASRVPNTTIFVLGSFERRVTVYAQQVRALNLVDALLSQGVLRESGRVAIVGGGAAGTTAAVALAKAAPNLKALDLFESRQDVLQLQRNSSRYLHPHFYDWPAPGSSAQDAGLPIMNWTAGTAGEVSAELWRQFDQTQRSSILHLFTGTKVTGLSPSAASAVRVLVSGASPIGRVYDVAILAIGFGLEAFLQGDTRSYWLPSDLSGPVLTQQDSPLIFISGNGDGGLVDFQMAAFDALEHRTICEFIMGLDLGPAAAELQAIEREAWEQGANVDLLAAYRARVKSLVPNAAWQSIYERLRPNVRVRFHTNEATLLRRTTALHNRVAAFLVIEADADLNRNLIDVITGVGFAGGNVPTSGPVALDQQASFEPYRRILRLGPDSAPNLAPFGDVLAGFAGRHTPPASALRPESPQLSASARARFGAVPAAAPAIVAPGLAAPAAPSGNTARVVISSESGQLTWSGDITPGEADQVWCTGRTFELHADVAAADATPLLQAAARLGAHAAGFSVYARDAQGWRLSMNALCAARRFPGPDLERPCLVSDWVQPPPLLARKTSSVADLAADVQSRLDVETLRLVHEGLHQMLGPAAQEMGWPIEPQLRVALWNKWEEWHAALLANPDTRRRFLLLLATERDQHVIDGAALVPIGARLVRPFLTKPAIFGLIFAVCSGHAVSPAHAGPGNVVGQGITGHVCGVSWINGREIGATSASRQAWTTGVVLLAQLKEAFQRLAREERFDRLIGEPARVGSVSAAEEPLVIGADDTFVDAVGAGEQSVRDYLSSIFRWRAELARATLENGSNA